MTWQKELESLKRSDGVLDPKDVVNFAKNPKTALHSKFEWDNVKAAHEHRLWQARLLIKACVTVIDHDKPPVHAFVSLESDRRNGGGYRVLADVLSDDERRDELMQQSLKELRVWQKKYEQLEALAPIYEAAEQVREAFVAPQGLARVG